MANNWNVQDVYQLFNGVIAQGLGRTDLAAVNTSSFATVGEIALNLGADNILKAISQTMVRTIFSVRAYRGKLLTLWRSEDRWGGYYRKLTPISHELEESENFNTDLNPNMLDDGQSIDMYKIKSPKALQLNFMGAKTLQDHLTRFYYQMIQAFSSPEEFMRFYDMIMVDWNNLINSVNEQQARLTLINYMAGLQEMNTGNVIDLIASFNKENGTSYTRAEILSQHLTEFMQHFVSEVQIYSNKLTDRSVLNHAQITGKGEIIRHTPKDRQRLIMYSPFFIKAEARVFSEIFNPLYLELGRNFEQVNYWQSQKPGSEAAISAIPNILDVATGISKTGTQQEIPYVLGILFDEEAIGVLPKFQYSSVTPFNSAGGYSNTYYHWCFNSMVDYTENALLFVLGDGGASGASARSAKG